MTPLPQLSDTEFRQVQRVVYEAAGILITGKGRTLLGSRVRRRVKALGLDSFRQYLRMLSGDDTGSERSALLDAISTNETSFFRSPAHFRWFADEFLPQQAALAGTQPGRPLRIWSAACSTGEEAYSLAIKVALQRGQLGDLAVELLATDLSASAIQRASRGIYSAAAVTKLDHAARQFFEPHQSQMMVVEDLRRQLLFCTHNLMQPAPYRDLDCVFLRNVLIYFDPASKATALAHAVAALRPGGYLVVGPSEGVVDIPDGLQREQSFLFRRVAPQLT